VTPRETPRQAKVRRMAARFTDEQVFHEHPGFIRAHLVQFGLAVWQAARRQTIRELGSKRSRTRLAERARKAGL
jgi:hypothetical protein